MRADISIRGKAYFPIMIPLAARQLDLSILKCGIYAKHRFRLSMLNHQEMLGTKGQLISKGLFDVSDSTKQTMKFFKGFLP